MHNITNLGDLMKLKKINAFYYRIGVLYMFHGSKDVSNII